MFNWGKKKDSSLAIDEVLALLKVKNFTSIVWSPQFSHLKILGNIELWKELQFFPLSWRCWARKIIVQVLMDFPFFCHVFLTLRVANAFFRDVNLQRKKWWNWHVSSKDWFIVYLVIGIWGWYILNLRLWKNYGVWATLGWTTILIELLSKSLTLSKSQLLTASVSVFVKIRNY